MGWRRGVGVVGVVVVWEAGRVWRPGGKRPGGAGLPGKWTFPFSNNKKPRPWCAERSPALSPTSRAKHTSSRPPPPTSQPCPAFPVNTSTSSGEGLAVLGAGGHTRRPASPAHNGWPRALAGPSNSPGLPCHPEKCHPWRELDSPNASLAQAGHGKSAGPRRVPPPRTSPFHHDATCSVLEVKALVRSTESEASLPGFPKPGSPPSLPARQPPSASVSSVKWGEYCRPQRSHGEDSVS